MTSSEPTSVPVQGKFTWDPEAHAGYLAFTDIQAGESVHQRSVPHPLPGYGELILDFDASGRLLGIEFLDSRVLPPLLAQPGPLTPRQ